MCLVHATAHHLQILLTLVSITCFMWLTTGSMLTYPCHTLDSNPKVQTHFSLGAHAAQTLPPKLIPQIVFTLKGFFWCCQRVLAGFPRVFALLGRIFYYNLHHLVAPTLENLLTNYHFN